MKFQIYLKQIGSNVNLNFRAKREEHFRLNIFKQNVKQDIRKKDVIKLNLKLSREARRTFLSEYLEPDAKGQASRARA